MAKKDQPFFNPFGAMKGLKAELEKDAAEKKKPAPKPPPTKEPAKPVNEELMFLEAMQGVKRVGPEKAGAPRKKPDAPVKRRDDTDDAESHAALADLVDGSQRFDYDDDTGHIEATMHGLDRRILQRLKRGEYPVEAKLDLHGLHQDKAKDAVARFLVTSRDQNKRCVLIVHGRGLNSEDQVPVLKRALRTWLERGPIQGSILAFCSARPQDGGVGAVYVLLRRPPPGRP